MRKHLAILKYPYLKALVDGQKTIEARLTKTRREPFGQIDVGDLYILSEAVGRFVRRLKLLLLKFTKT